MQITIDTRGIIRKITFILKCQLIRADKHPDLNVVYVSIYTIPLVFIIGTDVNLPIVPKYTRTILYVNVLHSFGYLKSSPTYNCSNSSTYILYGYLNCLK